MRREAARASCLAPAARDIVIAPRALPLQIRSFGERRCGRESSGPGFMPPSRRNPMRRALLLPLLLAACASGVPVERQVVVTGDRFAAVQGEASLLVRTFLPAEGNQRQEVVGATCNVVSSLYETTLVTPARLVVPNFGPQSPEILFDCRAGERSGGGHAEIVTRWQTAPGYWGFAGYGPYPGYPWGWGWPGWDFPGPGYPVSDYPNLNIVLR
jgi:hypothetical protein